MLKLSVITAVFLFVMGFFPSRGLDFEDKSLLKELQKVSGTDNPEWKEIAVPESLLVSNSVQGKFLLFSGNTIELNKYVYVGRVNSCRQGGCSNSAQPLNMETSEYFDYLIVFDSAPKVQLVKVYNYQATHGQEMTNKGWLKQFQGYDGTRALTVGKSIDAISGATVSVFSITDDIQEKTRVLKKILSK